MPTRRNILKLFGGLVLLSGGTGAYAVAGEPMVARVKHDRIRLQRWQEGLSLRVAALADLHACEPWMSASRIAKIVERTNALRPDLVVLLGDYVGDHRYRTADVPNGVWAEALGALKAPLGVHAVLGNHDWWRDREAQLRGHGPVEVGTALEKAGIRVYENDAVRLEKDGKAFWLAGLGDQIALAPNRAAGRRHWRGVDDLPALLDKMDDDAPALLMVHEPDIFPRVPARFSLTMAGHTHGGQVRLFGYSPVVPSAFGNRYAYGHVRERDDTGRPRDLLVSAGLGCSIAPLRFGIPPEINLIEIEAAPNGQAV